MSEIKLAKSAGSMSAAVFISRILGLVRDIVFANFFGTSYAADAFQVAFQIPNLLRKLFGEGALSAAFIPIYNELKVKNSNRSYSLDFGISILSLVTLFLLVICFIGVLVTPLIVKILAPGFDEQTFTLTLKLTRILFPYLLLIGLSSTFISILNSHNYFFVPGLSSALLNFGMVSLILGFNFFNNQLTLENNIVLFAFGVIFGGVLQTAINLPTLKKIGYTIKLNINFKSKTVGIFFQKFIPGVIGLAIRQINLAADLILASFLVTGSIAALQYGNRLMQLPLGVFGVAISTAILPLLSRYSAEKNWSKLNESLRFAAIGLAFIMLPVTVFLIGLGRDMLTVIFLRGAFDYQALEMSYKALVFYSSGLIFFSLNRTIIPVFYANKDTKTPVIISAYIIIINISLNIIFMSFMQHSGLALATTVSSAIHYFFLLTYMRKKYQFIKTDNLLSNIFKLFCICLFIFFNILIINRLTPELTFYWRIVKLFVVILLYSLFYYRLAICLKVDYVEQIKTQIWKKFGIS